MALTFQPHSFPLLHVYLACDHHLLHHDLLPFQHRFEGLFSTDSKGCSALIRFRILLAELSYDTPQILFPSSDSAFKVVFMVHELIVDFEILLSLLNGEAM
ncbi:hypothetical protein ACSBR1_021659 [Camellia fascicularis]